MHKKLYNALNNCVRFYRATSLTANVAEDVGAHVGKHEHRDGQSAV